MKLLDLKLENIGPFKKCEIALSPDKQKYGYNDYVSKAKHLIITGENGTGKSIIIDAIRTIMYGIYYSLIERQIFSSFKSSKLNANIQINKKVETISIEYDGYVALSPDENYIWNQICGNIQKKLPTNFILDFWNSKLSTGTFEISSMELLDVNKIFLNPFSGVHKNADVVKSIVFFDYLKDGNSEESQIGKFLYETTVKIINNCIIDGKFIGVSRKNLSPLFVQFGNEIGIDKLSSGSIYIMQRMLSLLVKAYAAHVLNQTPINKILEVEGMLLIDEAETHLHPKWQKVLFKNILDIFPNIQIIATTHSPFIVSSLDGAEVIVCKAGKDGCYIENETENYANKPIEEILRMPLFDTDSFNSEISDLLRERKDAIKAYDEKTKHEIEIKLEKLNPEYFKYLKIGYL